MYDVVVIGGGPGGYAAAIRAAQLGGKVALVEADLLGGTCVNRGCIPTKVWSAAARSILAVQQMSELGIQARIEKTDFDLIVARKNGVANDIRTGMGALLANNGVEVVNGRAVFENAREIRVGKTLLEAEKVIIATGARTETPDVPGLTDALLSFDQLFDLTKLPDSVLICGDGHVEVELAFILRCFGVNVHLVGESSRILPFADHDSSQRLTHELKKCDLELTMRAKLAAVERSGQGFCCRLNSQEAQTINTDRVIFAPRVPNSRNLELEKAGVTVDEIGGIQVNDYLETSSSGIYAIGDVLGGIMQSHAASAMAVTAAENAMGKHKQFRFQLIPKTCWTIPELGSVGLTEDEAEEQGYDLDIGEFPYAINGLSMTSNQPAGSVKIIKETRDGEILWVHIVGPNATELTGEAVLAIQMECTAEELAASIRAHPTFSEAVVDAARDAENWALYLPRR
ncbi:MAG: dihydrolipoyl dehydrogenase [Deltaproteobacteria bacterium]|nr:dihydrolipoyl dehydrogenase [Deltaproteobacteria bacterium]